VRFIEYQCSEPMKSWKLWHPTKEYPLNAAGGPTAAKATKSAAVVRRGNSHSSDDGSADHDASVNSNRVTSRFYIDLNGTPCDDADDRSPSAKLTTPQNDFAASAFGHNRDASDSTSDRSIVVAKSPKFTAPPASQKPRNDMDTSATAAVTCEGANDVGDNKSSAPEMRKAKPLIDLTVRSTILPPEVRQPSPGGPSPGLPWAASLAGVVPAAIRSPVSPASCGSPAVTRTRPAGDVTAPQRRFVFGAEQPKSPINSAPIASAGSGPPTTPAKPVREFLALKRFAVWQTIKQCYAMRFEWYDRPLPQLFAPAAWSVGSLNKEHRRKMTRYY
jgi:hypothetical protein